MGVLLVGWVDPDREAGRGSWVCLLTASPCPGGGVPQA